MATPATYVYPKAVGSCSWCAWRIEVSGEYIDEVAAFLQARLFDHMRAMHPERLRRTQ
jgi:hypothetical protein